MTPIIKLIISCTCTKQNATVELNHSWEISGCMSKNEISPFVSPLALAEIFPLVSPSAQTTFDPEWTTFGKEDLDISELEAETGCFPLSLAACLEGVDLRFTSFWGWTKELSEACAGGVPCIVDDR